MMQVARPTHHGEGWPMHIIAGKPDRERRARTVCGQTIQIYTTRSPKADDPICRDCLALRVKP